MRDPYAVLGVDPWATDEEIRSAYRARSLLVHPDLHEGRPEQVRLEAKRAMRQLTEAYETVTATRARAGSGTGSGSAGGDQDRSFFRRLGRLVVATDVGRDSAEAAGRGGPLAFRLGWLVGRRRSR